MKSTIVFAHPWHGSFNKGILDQVESQLQKKKKDYQLIDLHKDNFNPVLAERDLALFSKGKSKDELVNKYQTMIKDSDELIFIFPIWWFEMPAIVKGFIDKVMLKDYAYIETSVGLKGLLTNIRKTTVITTSEFPTWYLKLLAGNAIQKTFIGSTLKSLGLKKVKWLNNPMTSSGSKASREKFLQRVSKHLS
ncbi:NAD(P)H-dependent oxidoreductase [Spirochaeta cellobiosiphila]|uniref:NAD(P)H-dependent oxidoreductase n=1 Tax=Spirochaeta cellobiosiphila TaxID=504483 RepID=UPI000414DB08|nr:NAD(P)H-dependent oxidoreductase [Spirochaeta cellobiosiphila]